MLQIWGKLLNKIKDAMKSPALRLLAPRGAPCIMMPKCNLHLQLLLFHSAQGQSFTTVTRDRINTNESYSNKGKKAKRTHKN